MKNFFKFIVPIFALMVLSSCGEKDALDYYNPQKLILDREEKVFYFHTSTDSPLPQADRKAMKPLEFYKPDSSYVVKAVLVPATVKDTVVFKTTNDTIDKEMKLMGRMRFALNGEQRLLNAYLPMRQLKENPDGPHTLFIPFSDKTNGEETYGGGRYIDIPLSKDFNHIIDFNEAYNPYCAYNDGFACPIVPEENYLNTKIEAGEKNYK